jgi:predicted metal-dependent hydrolase
VELSDYLQDAPDAVIRDTCKSIVAWSRGRRYVSPESLSQYVRTPEFIVSSRPKYLKRCRSLMLTQQGRCKNLIDSVERLMEAGLVEDDDIRNSYYTWADHMAKYRFGQCNQTFRVVTVNPILDDDRVPDEIVDYVVYHETLHLRQDTSKHHRPHNAQFRSWEHQFPDYDKAEQYLRNIYTILK